MVYLLMLFATPRRKLFRGKVLTMWVRRAIRFFRPRGFGSLDVRGLILRTFQVMVPAFYFDHGSWQILPWLWGIVLYLDDYLTGDEDQWKRFKDWARNKIKWRMELPAPARQETA